jgi:hypothetical protein
VVVVDVDDERGRLEEAGIGPQAALVRAVEGEYDPLFRVLGRRAANPLELHESVLVRERDLSEQVHDRVLAELLEREAHRDDGSERVAVGVLVGRDHEAVVGADRLRDRVEISCLHVHLGQARQ